MYLLDKVGVYGFMPRVRLALHNGACSFGDDGVPSCRAVAADAAAAAAAAAAVAGEREFTMYSLKITYRKRATIFKR